MIKWECDDCGEVVKVTMIVSKETWRKVCDKCLSTKRYEGYQLYENKK